MDGADDRQELLNWAEALEEYARDWDKTFNMKPEYFTQEFWYMFVPAVVANWNGRPLTITELQGKMKSGAPNTRRTRIQAAQDDGYLIIDETSKFHYVIPTEKLEKVITEHFRRTLKMVKDRINTPPT